jgi:hypothetical protein
MKGGETIILIDKDIELLRFISKTGVCTLAQAKQVYGADNKWYHYKRIQRLEEDRYVIKRGKYIELSSKGAETVGQKKYYFRRNDIRETHAEMAHITLSLKGFEILSNRAVREEYGLNRKTHFKNVLIHEGLYHFIYLLTDNPTRKLINGIKSELRTLASSGIARHSIVFAPTPTAMAAFGVDGCKQDQLFLLPYPSGVDLLKSHFTNPIKINAPRTRKPFADYEAESHYIAVLTLNNLARRQALAAYFETHHTKPVVIYCLESQLELFSYQYPRAKLRRVVPEPKENTN